MTWADRDAGGYLKTGQTTPSSSASPQCGLVRVSRLPFMLARSGYTINWKTLACGSRLAKFDPYRHTALKA